MERAAFASDNGSAMMDDLTSLLDRIAALVDERTDGAPERLLGRIENTLTDGYAQALALEGEVLRTEKEIALAVARIRGGGDVTRLATLADRRGAAERELERLRARLQALSRRAERVRRNGSGPAALDETASDGVDRRLNPILDL
jgi:hypothetical protein